MTRIAKPILLAASFALLAPVAGAAASPGSTRVQQAVTAQLAHRTVRQQDETLRRQLDLRRQRAAAERSEASAALAKATRRQP